MFGFKYIDLIIKYLVKKVYIIYDLLFYECVL